MGDGAYGLLAQLGDLRPDGQGRAALRPRKGRSEGPKEVRHQHELSVHSLVAAKLAPGRGGAQIVPHGAG